MTLDPQIERLADEIRELRQRLDEVYFNERPVLAYGTYTPTIDNTTNVAASNPYLATYLRVGNMVWVAGTLDIDPTAAAPTATTVGISLPIASNFTAFTELAGNANAISSTQSGPVYADATNDRARLDFTATSAAAFTWTYVFGYRIL